jgi:EmrB/QacA subfamily drug resistance transporter
VTAASVIEAHSAPSRQLGPSRRRWAVLGVLSVSLLIVSLDNTILNVALPTILRSMRASSSELQWIVDAYAVVFAGLLLVVGTLGDRVGRKWVFLAGLLVFAAGSAASAWSSTPDELIAARAFMGVGAAAIMPSTLSILTKVFSDEQRATAIGIWSGTSGLGVAIGPVAGGWLLAHYWWGSVFLVNLPVAVMGSLLTAWLVPNSKNLGSKRPDPLGAGLSVVGMALLLWGIIEAPNRSWAAPVVLATLAGGALVLGAFILWERRSTHPMLELSSFSSARFSGAVAAMGFVIFALMGGLFVLTQYLQFSLGYSALAAGLRVAPVAAVLLVTAPLSTVVLRFTGTKPVVFLGMGLITTGLLLMSSTTVRGGYLDALPAFLLIGAGTGFALAPSTDSVMGSVPAELAGAAAATNGTAIQTGGALGVAVLGSLLNGRYQAHLSPVLHGYQIPVTVLHTITGSLGGALTVAQHIGGALGAGLAAAARQAFVAGMDLSSFVAGVVVGVSALVVVAVLPNRGTKPGAVATGAGC